MSFCVCLFACVYDFCLCLCVYVLLGVFGHVVLCASRLFVCVCVCSFLFVCVCVSFCM